MAAKKIAKLYRFTLDCGRMGSLEGTFVATDREVKAAIGKRAYFGEVLGKHSEIECSLAREHFAVLTDDQTFIDKAAEYGLIPSGHNPLAYVEEP